MKYFGVKLIDEVIKAQIRATILINPRPTNQEFVKYSFPSKNMEYMVSGTPLLTTKLPGMPEEYYPYIYLLEDETPDGVARRLQDVLSISEVERNKKAEKARDYVLREKSSNVQAAKVLSFCKEQVE